MPVSAAVQRKASPSNQVRIYAILVRRTTLAGAGTLHSAKSDRELEINIVWRRKTN